MKDKEMDLLIGAEVDISKQTGMHRITARLGEHNFEAVNADGLLVVCHREHIRVLKMPIAKMLGLSDTMASLLEKELNSI